MCVCVCECIGVLDLSHLHFVEATKKMEERKVKLVLIGLLLALGVLVGEANASFKSCYESCFLICLITPNHSAFSCSYKCLKDCIIPPPSDFPQTSAIHTRNIYYCKLGCASSLCTNFSSKHSPSSEKVESCVDSCSDTCTKN